jgi:protein ImuB
MTAPVYACIWVRQFPAQALLRLRPVLRDKPVAVIEGERPLERICSVNRHALALGIREGMTRPEAETFEIPLLRRSLSEEKSAKSALLNLYAVYTPRIEERSKDNHCIHVLDIGGTERLFGAAHDLCKQIRNRAKELGFALQIAISRNFHTALCLAASTGGRIIHVPEGEQQAWLQKLPLAALHASDEYQDEFEETFRNWGLKTFGDLAALPEVDLIARLGQHGRRLRLIARGEHPHHFQPVEAPFALEEFFAFDTPVDLLESLLFVLNPMVEQLVLRAGAHTFALAVIHVTLILERAAEHKTSIRPALPTQDRHALLKLLQLDLAAHPPPAAVLAIALHADPGPVSKVQLGLFSPQSPEPMRLEVTLARIAAIVGEGRVGKACLADTHRPDTHTTEKFTVEEKIDTRDAVTRAASPALRWLRPPLDLGISKSRPDRLWYQNACYTIERFYGPWTVSGEWWSANAWSTDSWDFAGRSGDGSILLGILSHDRLRRSWRLEALYD